MNVALPTEYVAVGQSYELSYERGTLFTVTEVTRRWSSFDRAEIWHVTLMCIVSPGPWYRMGGTSTEVSRDGTLRTAGYRRLA
jgi:hypothetical protein